LIAQKSDSFSSLSENQTVLKVCPLQKRGISVIIKRKKKQGVLPKGVEPLDKKKKVDGTVRKETIYIAAAVLILSMLMQAVFLIIKRWDYTVLLGNLLGGGVAVLNFFLMGLTVQKATGEEEKRARTLMHTSQIVRTFAMFGVACSERCLTASTSPLFSFRFSFRAFPFCFVLSSLKERRRKNE